MKIITVEDEFPTQQELGWLVKEHSQMGTVGTFGNGLDALRFLQHNRVDAIFLDIDIPSLDGVLLMQNISQFVYKPFIVFTITWKEHAVEASKLEVFNYILKLYQESCTTGVLQELEAAWQQRQTSSTPAVTIMRESDTINLVEDERIIVTPTNGIYYVEAYERMTFVYTRRESYVMPMNITEFCSKLPPSHFSRCHRSPYVSLNKVRETKPWFNNTHTLRLKDLDSEVLVNRSEVEEFRQLTHLQSEIFMKAPGLLADQQFSADLFSGLVLNPQLLGRVWFASQPASLPVGSLCTDFLRLDIVLRGEYDDLPEAKQQRLMEREMLSIPARATSLPVNNKPVMLLSLVSTPTWLELSLHDGRTTSLLYPVRQIQLPNLQRDEDETMLIALTHLSRSLLEQNTIQPLVLGSLHLCHSVMSIPPGNSQPCGDFLYHNICNWVRNNCAQPLTCENVTQLFSITPSHLSKLLARYGTVRSTEYVRWVRMTGARMTLQKYHLSIHEVAQCCGFPDSDCPCRVLRRQFDLTPGEYNARFQG